MKIAHITAGAGGMFCGSCLHDNTLVAALCRLGHDALLIPTYTPIRTDESDQTRGPVFLGGINVYLQQLSSFFRHTPWFVDRIFDSKWLLGWVSRIAMGTSAEKLGPLTLSMLKGSDGFQAKEIRKLSYWLKHDIKPEIIHLTNALLSGVVKNLKADLGVPLVCSLQGDDIFLEALPASHSKEARKLISENARLIDGFLSTSAAYADFMSEYLEIPREKIEVVLPGLDLKFHSVTSRSQNSPSILGYFARICPEKGLHLLVDAWLRLRKSPAGEKVKLHVGGWLGEGAKPYFNSLCDRVKAAGVGKDFAHIQCPDMATKVAFFQGIDLLCVPSVYKEPKGLYILEAWAHGVPVLQPAHGSFPELIAQAPEAGALYPPGNEDGLYEKLLQLVEDGIALKKMGKKGRQAVETFFHSERMAKETEAFYQKFLNRSQG